jgi:hypothetical protein
MSTITKIISLQRSEEDSNADILAEEFVTALFTPSSMPYLVDHKPCCRLMAFDLQFFCVVYILQSHLAI